MSPHELTTDRPTAPEATDTATSTPPPFDPVQYKATTTEQCCLLYTSDAADE